MVLVGSEVAWGLRAGSEVAAEAVIVEATAMLRMVIVLVFKTVVVLVEWSDSGEVSTTSSGSSDKAHDGWKER